MNKTLLIAVLIIVLVVIALIIVFIPQLQSMQNVITTPTPTITPTSSAADESVTPTLTNYPISIQDSAFSPDSITIKVGDTVTWTNEDSMAHTVSANDFDSGTLNTGQSYSYTFTTAGTFAYICSIHPDMTGTVIVQ